MVSKGGRREMEKGLSIQRGVGGRMDRRKRSKREPDTVTGSAVARLVETER